MPELGRDVSSWGLIRIQSFMTDLDLICVVVRGDFGSAIASGFAIACVGMLLFVADSIDYFLFLGDEALSMDFWPVSDDVQNPVQLNAGAAFSLLTCGGVIDFVVWLESIFLGFVGLAAFDHF